MPVAATRLFVKPASSHVDTSGMPRPAPTGCSVARRVVVGAIMAAALTSCGASADSELETSEPAVEQSFGVATFRATREADIALDNLVCVHDTDLDDETLEQNSPKWSCGFDLRGVSRDVTGHADYDLVVHRDGCWTSQQGGGSSGESTLSPGRLSGCLPADMRGVTLSIRPADGGGSKAPRPSSSSLAGEYAALSQTNRERSSRSYRALERALQPETFEDFVATSKASRRLIRAKVGDTAEDHRGRQRPAVRGAQCRARVECSLAWQQAPVGLLGTALGAEGEEDIVQQSKELFKVLFSDSRLQVATITAWGTVSDIGGKSSDAPILRISCDRTASRRIDWDSVEKKGLSVLCRYRRLADFD